MLSAEQNLRGRVFRAARTFLGLEIADVARAADVDPSHLSRLERGSRPISDQLAARLLRALEDAASSERGR